MSDHPKATVSENTATPTRRTHRPDLWAGIAAAVISALAVWGDYVRRAVSGTDTWHTSPSYAVAAVALVLALTAALTCALTWVFRRADAALERNTMARSSEPSSEPSSELPATATAATTDAATTATATSTPALTTDAWFASMRGHRLRPTLLFLACWAPYLLIRFPGNLDPDTQWQLLEAYGMAPRSDHHPWFDTLVFGAFWRLGSLGGLIPSHLPSLLLYALAQMAVTAAVFALVIGWMRFLGLPRGLVRASIVFLAAYPVVPLFAQTMAKDMLYGWAYVLFVLLMAEAARTRGGAFASRRFVVWLTVAAMLLMLTKKTGAITVLLCGIVLVCAIRRLRVRAAACLGLALVLVAGVWQHAALPAMGVAPGESKETMTMTSQQTALYIRWYGDELTDDDWHVLEGVYTEAHELGDVYVPSRADATKDRWRSDAPSKAVHAFFRWYVGAMARHPEVFAIALSATALPVIYPDTTSLGDESYVSYRDNLDETPDTADAAQMEPFLLGMTQGQATLDEVQRTITRTAQRPHWAHVVSQGFDRVYAWVEHWLPVLVLKAVFTTWVPIVCLAYCIRRRHGMGVVMLVPAVVTLATLVAGPVVLPRYIVPCVYALPLTIAACATAGVMTGGNGRRDGRDGR